MHIKYLQSFTLEHVLYASSTETVKRKKISYLYYLRTEKMHDRNWADNFAFDRYALLATVVWDVA